jgi:hypothetical protein
VNAAKSKIGRPNQIKFLGFGYFIDKEGKYQPKPHKLSVEKLKRKLKALTCRKWSISLDARIEKLRQQIVGWVNYFRIAKMKTVLKGIDAKLRKRMRVIIWKQWKKTLARYEALRKLGATHLNAYMTANCRKSYQYVCCTATIHATITNRRLEQRGLPSMSSLFAKVHLAV